MSRRNQIQAVAAAAPPPESPACNAPKPVDAAAERQRGVRILAKSLFTDLLRNGFEVAHIVALSTELLDLTTDLLRLRAAAHAENEALSREEGQMKLEEATP